MAPHVIRPLRRHAAADAGPAPRRCRCGFGLFVYGYAGRTQDCCPATRNVDLVTHHPVGQPLNRSFRYGVSSFSDCLVDDVWLVVLNALDAAERGAVIRTRTRCTRGRAARRMELVLNTRGRREVATARVVNAAPLIGEVADTVDPAASPQPVRRWSAAITVVPRHFEHDYGYFAGGRQARVRPAARAEFT